MLISWVGHFGFLIPFILYYINSNLVLNASLAGATAVGLISNYNIYHLVLSWFIINTLINIVVDSTTKEEINLETNILENYLQIQDQIVQLRRRTKKEKPVIRVVEDTPKDIQPRQNICTLVTSYFRRS